MQDIENGGLITGPEKARPSHIACKYKYYFIQHKSYLPNS